MTNVVETDVAIESGRVRAAARHVQSDGRAAPPRGRFSLRRLVVSRLLIYILPIVTIGVVLHWQMESRLLTEVFDGTLHERATSLATLVTTQSGRLELEFADEYMTQYSRDEDPYYFQIWLPDGSLLEKSYSLGIRELPQRVGSVDMPVSFTAELDDGTRVRAVGVGFPVREDSDAASGGHRRVAVVVAAPHGLLQASLNRGLLEALVVGILSALGISAVVFASLHKASTLVQRVVDEVAAIDRSVFDRRVDVEASPVEIQPILTALNESLEVIAESVMRERRFTSDVAHELRTPIAELRTATEVALRWPERVEQAELARDTHDIAIQMGGLVESLLQLARLEGLELNDDRRDLDLVELVHAQLERIARARGVSPARVQIAAASREPIRANRALWEVVVGNLLDNALEHSPPDSTVSVKIRRTGDACTLRVENEAPDLDPEDAAQLTRRLWRGEFARGKGSHFGLGLSIVEAACRRMGVDLEFTANENRFVASLQARVLR